MRTVAIGLAGMAIAAMLGGCAQLQPRQTERSGLYDDAALTTPSPIGGTVDSGGVLAGGHNK